MKAEQKNFVCNQQTIKNEDEESEEKKYDKNIKIKSLNLDIVRQ